MSKKSAISTLLMQCPLMGSQPAPIMSAIERKRPLKKTRLNSSENSSSCRCLGVN